MKRSELIEKWLEALESGEYKQGTGVLVEGLVDTENNKHPKYCCLGVLCDVVVENHVLKIDMINLDERAQGALPTAVAKLAGLNTLGEFNTLVVYRGKRYSTLAQMNDGGVKFKTIARIIREQLAKKNFAKVG